MNNNSNDLPELKPPLDVPGDGDDFDPEDNCMLPVYAPPGYEDDDFGDDGFGDENEFKPKLNVPAPVYAPPRPPN